MGANYYSYLIVGCEVDEKKLKVPKRVRNCKCKVDNIESAEYCPKCGAAAWYEGYDPVEGINEDEDRFFDFDIVHNTDDRNCWLAIRMKEVGDSEGCFDAVMLETPDDLSDLRKEMKDKLGPLGLWDEKKFGVWAIQYCSY